LGARADEDEDDEDIEVEDEDIEVLPYLIHYRLCGSLESGCCGLASER
jgi:hypothetical protein